MLSKNTLAYFAPPSATEIFFYLDGERRPLVVDVGQVDPGVVGVEVISGGQEVIVISGLVSISPTFYE